MVPCRPSCTLGKGQRGREVDGVRGGGGDWFLGSQSLAEAYAAQVRPCDCWSSDTSVTRATVTMQYDNAV